MDGTKKKSDKKKMSKIKVVLWDIDGTLLNFEESEKHAIRACFANFQMGVCTDEMLETYKQINKTYWKRLERGEIAKQELLVSRFHDFFAKYQLNDDLAAAFNQEYQIRLGDTICFCEHALETIQALRGEIMQYAVTNGTKAAQERKLAKSGLNELLDGIFISEEVGIEKPMIGFFDAVFKQIGTFKKDEIMIVGDSLTSDMQGGVNAGIVTCWFNQDKAENDLQLPIDYEITNLKQVLEILWEV